MRDGFPAQGQTLRLSPAQMKANTSAWIFKKKAQGCQRAWHLARHWASGKQQLQDGLSEAGAGLRVPVRRLRCVMVRTTTLCHKKAKGAAFGLSFSAQHLVSLNQFPDSQTKQKCICEQSPRGEAKNPFPCFADAASSSLGRRASGRFSFPVCL